MCLYRCESCIFVSSNFFDLFFVSFRICLFFLSFVENSCVKEWGEDKIGNNYMKCFFFDLDCCG